MPLELLNNTALDKFYGQDNLPWELPKSTSLDESYEKLPKSTALDEFHGQDSLPFEHPKVHM